MFEIVLQNTKEKSGRNPTLSSDVFTSLSSDYYRCCFFVHNKSSFRAQTALYNLYLGQTTGFMPFHPDRLCLEAIKSGSGICLFVKQASNQQQSCRSASRTAQVAQAGYFTRSLRLLSEN